MKENLKQKIIKVLREDIQVLIGLKQNADLEDGYVISGKDHVASGLEESIESRSESIRIASINIAISVFSPRTCAQHQIARSMII